MIGFLVKKVACGIPVHMIVSVIKHVKLVNNEILKIAHAKKVFLQIRISIWSWDTNYNKDYGQRLQSYICI